MYLCQCLKLCQNHKILSLISNKNIWQRLLAHDCVLFLVFLCGSILACNILTAHWYTGVYIASYFHTWISKWALRFYTSWRIVIKYVIMEGKGFIIFLACISYSYLYHIIEEKYTENSSARKTYFLIKSFWKKDKSKRSFYNVSPEEVDRQLHQTLTGSC